METKNCEYPTNFRGWYVVSTYQPDGNTAWTPLYRWCEETFERRTWSYEGEGVFAFQNERDANWFTLRWI